MLAALLVSFSGLGLYALILRDRFGGLYEAISDESEWDIHDASGTEAVLTRTRRLHFLQNGVFAIRDYAWGDGDVLADYQCSPGSLRGAAALHGLALDDWERRAADRGRLGDLGRGLQHR